MVCREKFNVSQWSILRPFKKSEKGQVKETGGQEKASREEKAKPSLSKRADWWNVWACICEYDREK